MIKSSNGSVASTTNGDSSRRGKAFLSHLHENNWCFLDLAVQQAMNSSVKDDSMVETRRSSPRKLQSTSQWTENAKEVACALSVYFFGIDTSKNTICLPPELPQDEKRKETIKAAFGFINQWRKQLKAGTYVEYFDGLRIQKATVDQNLKGVDSKGFQVPILSETGSLEDYSLKQEDIAIKLAARPNWLIFSPHFPISKDIGIAPEGSFRILAEASNGSFGMQEAEEETNSGDSVSSTNSEDLTIEEYSKKYDKTKS